MNVMNNKAAKRALVLPSVLAVSALAGCGAYVEPGSPEALAAAATAAQSSAASATAVRANVPSLPQTQDLSGVREVVEDMRGDRCQACYRLHGEDVCSDAMAACVAAVTARGLECHNPCLVC